MRNLFIKNTKAKAIGIVGFYIFFTLFSIYIILTKLDFKYELENFFPKEDPDMEFYGKYIEKFSSDFDLSLITIEAPNTVFDTLFLKNVKAFTDSLKQSQYINQVISPLQMARYRDAFPVPIATPYFHMNNDSLLKNDSIILSSTKHIVKEFISMETNSLLIVAQMKLFLNNEECDKSIHEINALLKHFSFDKYRLAGRVKAQNYIVNKMQKDFIQLAILTILCLAIIVFLTFRNIWSVILCAMIVTLGLIFTLLCMVLLGKSLNVVSIILPNILFVVGVSDSVHVFNNYFTELNKGKSKFDALWSTVTEIGLATFLTAITAAIGFATLVTVNVAPIQEFGIFSAIGILLIFCISFTLLPAILYLLPTFYLKEEKSLVKTKWFEDLYAFNERNTNKVFIVFFLIFIPIVYGISKIEVNNFFTEELRDSDPHKKDFVFFDKHFGGVRPFELYFHVKDSSQNIFSYEIVKKIDTVEKYLTDVYKVAGINSSNTLVKFVNQMNNEGRENAFEISNNDSIHLINLEKIESVDNSNMMQSVVADNKQTTRITGRINDIGALLAKEKNIELTSFLNQVLDSQKIETRITGLGTILDKNNDSITNNIMTGLIFELLAISILMGFLFRSFSITIIALIPNVIPLLFIGGLMGWLGVHLNLSSSILFNIAFGICVDDTIHLLGAYRVNLGKKMSQSQALYHAYTHSGKAVAMTTLILCCGFFVMLTSSFVGIFNTGLLVGITLIIALISDLFLLQFFIKKFHHPKEM